MHSAALCLSPDSASACTPEYAAYSSPVPARDHHVTTNRLFQACSSSRVQLLRAPHGYPYPAGPAAAPRLRCTAALLLRWSCGCASPALHRCAPAAFLQRALHCASTALPLRCHRAFAARPLRLRCASAARPLRIRCASAAPFAHDQREIASRGVAAPPRTLVLLCASLRCFPCTRPCVLRLARPCAAALRRLARPCAASLHRLKDVRRLQDVRNFSPFLLLATPCPPRIGPARPLSPTSLGKDMIPTSPLPMPAACFWT